MTLMIRTTAYAASALMGAAIPLMATADATEGHASPFLANYHSSARPGQIEVEMPAAELEALRAQIWALTQQGGTIHCAAEGITAPCIDTAAFDAAQ